MVSAITQPLLQRNIHVDGDLFCCSIPCGELVERPTDDVDDITRVTIDDIGERLHIDWSVNSDPQYECRFFDPRYGNDDRNGLFSI